MQEDNNKEEPDKREVERCNFFIEQFRDEIVSDMESYMYDRSEKWQEGEAGEAYQSWLSNWEDASLDDEIDFEMPVLDEIDEPETDGWFAISPDEVTV